MAIARRPYQWWTRVCGSLKSLEWTISKVVFEIKRRKRSNSRLAEYSFANHALEAVFSQRLRLARWQQSQPELTLRPCRRYNPGTQIQAESPATPLICWPRITMSIFMCISHSSACLAPNHNAQQLRMISPNIGRRASEDRLRQPHGPIL